MQQTTIQTKDINSTIGLPKIGLGIHVDYQKKPEDGYLDLRKPIAEEYTSQHASEVNLATRYTLNGGDYHDELEALHKNVKPYLHDTNTNNAHDTYIHEVLKRGKPNGETVSHLFDVIHASPYSSYAERMHNTSYLSDKWTPFLDAHAKEKQSVFKKDDAHYTQEEINSIPSNFEIKGLRLLKHRESGHYFEFHPTDGLKYVGNRFNSHYNGSDGDHDDHVLHKTLTNESTYGNPAGPAVAEYTSDSSRVNRYLHKTYDNPSHAATAPEKVKELVNDVSSHFEQAHPLPHIPDFHVYTGVYAELNPRIHSSHRDEHGNFIFHNPSFTSTSIDNHTADDFAKVKEDNHYVASDDANIKHPIADVLKIRIPSGYPHGAYVQPISHHGTENEYLLDKGHTFVLDPKPTHYATKHKIIRMWNAELHPKDINTTKSFEDRTRNEKIDTVMHPDVTSEEIEKAANDGDQYVRAVAAKHPRVHPETLKTLAKDQMPKVRIAAMMNDHTPNDLIENSIKDYSSALGIARRKKVPEHLMDKLIDHDYSSVSEAIAMRHDLQEDHLAKLISTADPDNRIQGALASNPTMHPEVLHFLRKHPERVVRLNLAKNPSLPEKTANELMNDKDYYIRNTASKKEFNSDEVIMEISRVHCLLWMLPHKDTLFAHQ